METKDIFKMIHELGEYKAEELSEHCGIDLPDDGVLLAGIDHLKCILDTVEMNLKHDPTVAKWFINQIE